MAKGGPDLKRYMDKTLSLKLNGNRTIKVNTEHYTYHVHGLFFTSWYHGSKKSRMIYTNRSSWIIPLCYHTLSYLF